MQVEVWYDFFSLSRRKHVGIGASSASKAKVSLLTRGYGVAMVARQRQAEFTLDSMSPIDASNGQQFRLSDDIETPIHATSQPHVSLFLPI